MLSDISVHICWNDASFEEKKRKRGGRGMVDDEI